MIKLAVTLLQIATQIFRFLEVRRLISEGERRQIAKELAAVAHAAAASKQVRDNVDKMSDAQVDAALDGYYRD